MVSSEIRICYKQVSNDSEIDYDEYNIFYFLCCNDDAYIVIAKSLKEAIDFMSTTKNFLGPFSTCDRIFNLSFLTDIKSSENEGPARVDIDVIQSTSHGIKDLHIYRCTPEDIRHTDRFYIAESQKLLFDYLDSIGKAETYSSVQSVDFYNFSQIKGLFLVPGV